MHICMSILKHANLVPVEMEYVYKNVWERFGRLLLNAVIKKHGCEVSCSLWRTGWLYNIDKGLWYKNKAARQQFAT